VAWALAEAAGADAHLAGPAFHDMTRIAGSPRELWREILDQNQDEVRRATRRFLRALPR
jgi:prephenate dehydrogenase